MNQLLYSASLALNALEDPFLFALFASSIALAVFFINRSYGLGFFFSLSLTFVTVHSIKALFALPRPLEALVSIDGYRFPSMHAALAGTILSSLSWYANAHIRSSIGKTILVLVALFGICFVGYTRTVLGVHKPIDVIVGAFIGITVSMLVHAYLKRYG